MTNGIAALVARQSSARCSGDWADAYNGGGNRNLRFAGVVFNSYSQPAVDRSGLTKVRGDQEPRTGNTLAMFHKAESGYSSAVSRSSDDQGRRKLAEGRRRLADRDRAADAGERRDEYERGDWTTEGDPAEKARAQAVDENTDERPPTPTN